MRALRTIDLRDSSYDAMVIADGRPKMKFENLKFERS